MLTGLFRYEKQNPFLASFGEGDLLGWHQRDILCKCTPGDPPGLQIAMFSLTDSLYGPHGLSSLILSVNLPQLRPSPF